MNDKQIADLVRQMENYLKGKETSENLGAAASAAMILMVKACYESNAGSLIMKLSDCTFGADDTNKKDYIVTIECASNNISENIAVNRDDLVLIAGALVSHNQHITNRIAKKHNNKLIGIVEKYLNPNK